MQHSFHVGLRNSLRELIAFAERWWLAIGDLAHLSGFSTGEHPNAPSFRLLIQGNIRQNHPLETTLLRSPDKRWTHRAVQSETLSGMKGMHRFQNTFVTISCDLELRFALRARRCNLEDSIAQMQHFPFVFWVPPKTKVLWKGLRWADSRKSIRRSRPEPLFCESRVEALKDCESHAWGDSHESLERYENRFSSANRFARISPTRVANRRAI